MRLSGVCLGLLSPLHPRMRNSTDRSFVDAFTTRNPFFFFFFGRDLIHPFFFLLSFFLLSRRRTGEKPLDQSRYLSRPLMTRGERSGGEERGISRVVIRVRARSSGGITGLPCWSESILSRVR